MDKVEIPPAITRWLEANSITLDDGLPQLVNAMYAEFRQRAHFALRGSTGVSFQTTDLVHETYLRLARAGSIEIKSRDHFLALSAKTMRWVLMDSARVRQRLQRGGGAKRVPLDENLLMAEERAGELLALDAAIEQLAALDARLAEVVEYRVFGGLSVEDTSRVLGISTRTVKRDWHAARAFLAQELGHTP